MKIKNLLYAASALVLSLTSCSDKMNYDEYVINDDEYIKEMFGRVGGFMTAIYNDLDYDFGNYSGALLSSATDESVYSHPGNAIEDFYNGSFGPTNDLNKNWTKAWDGISYCNLLLDKFTGLKFPDYTLDTHYNEELRQYKNYEYEARWARAYFYFELVRDYRNVPLKIHDMSADAANALPQVSSDSIFNFIDSECAAIKDSIIVDYSEVGYPTKSETGRANKLAVMALRARAALYHASPLFNTTGDKSLWEEALRRNQELITEARAEGKSLSSDYSAMFTSTSWNDANAQKEIIFGHRTAASNAFEKYNFPIGMENAGGGNCPTQNLVDAFEMKNGKAIDEEGSGYDPQNPYANRDSRLELIVARNGEVWPNDTLKTYDGGANAGTVTYGTPTGYYLKKYVNKSTIIKNTGASSFYHIWITFRLAEFYLNYAEAALNVTGDGYTRPSGGTMTAADAINIVRKRAGQPDIETGLSFEEFKKKYENERFVELAFEGHRFYDLRRWEEAPEHLTEIRGMQITRNGDGSYTYSPRVISTRQWNNAWYLFPFPQKDVLNCGYTQNPGY